MMVKLFAALTDKAHDSGGLRRKAMSNQPRFYPALKVFSFFPPPPPPEAKRGHFAYLDCRSENLHPALLGISKSANMEA